jgi:hypothetical protein
MRNLSCLPLILVAAIVNGGCGSRDQPATPDPSAGVSEGDGVAREREAVEALKPLGANVALDEQGRAKVLRLTGPKITDAEMEQVAKLTELLALYLDGTKVTDAGMGHLEPLTKLETLHCISVTSRQQLRMLEALKQTTELEFIDTPLTDVLDTLGDFHDVSFAIDEKALQASNVRSDTPITAQRLGLSLREALDFVLGRLNVVWTIDGGDLVVTTKEALAEECPNLAALREAVPTLKDVLVDF